MGGEFEMINDNGRHAAGQGLRHTGWTGATSRGAASAARARRLLTTLAAAAAVASACLVSPAAIDAASAQRVLQISGAKRTATVLVPVGKTEDLRIDAPFTDITVGDPDVADVAPLTDRAISVLGKKVGTTRVTVYAERPAPCRHLRHRGDLRSVAPRHRGRPRRRPRHQGVVGQRPHHAVGHRARTRSRSTGR